MNETRTPRQLPLASVSEFEDALDNVIALASRELRIFDTTLGRRFNSIARAEAIRSFLLASRRNRLRIVIHETTHLDRDCPRLMTLLRSFSHAISIHETQPQAKLVYDPFTIADELHYARRFHFDEMRGLCGMDDPIGARTLIDRFEEIWEASSPSVSATTLGL
jgi:hypothetical protein